MTKHCNASSSKADPLASLYGMSTIDISDRLNAMLETERLPQYRCRDYLHHQPSRRQSSSQHSRSSSRSVSSRRSALRSALITHASRAKIVQWLYDCVDYLELQREIVAITMGYVDRFMSSSSSSSNDSSSCHKKVVAEAKRDATIYQLVAISALFLAAKQSDKLSMIDAEILVRVSHGSYSVQEILAMENTLLDALQWRLCGPTSLSVAYHAIALLAKVVDRKQQQQRRGSSSTAPTSSGSSSNRQRISSVIDFTRLQIELAISDYATSVLRNPSTIALASILNSMELLDFTPQEKRSFGRALTDWTNLNSHSEEVADTRMELHQVFDRQSNDVMSRANAATASSSSSRSSNKKKDSSSFYSTVSSSRSPVEVSEFTPRSSTSTRRKKPRRRKQEPSPTCVDALSFEKLRLEP